MADTNQYLIFKLDERTFALSINSIKRIALAVEVTPLPESPGIVLGVINVNGQIIPVVSIRRRFGLEEKAIGLMDHFVIAKTSTRTVAIVVDDVVGIQRIALKSQVSKDAVLPEMKHVKGIIKIDGNIIMIHDIDDFLSLEESRAVEKALTKMAEGKTTRKQKKK